MKASEFIEVLRTMIAEHGDLPLVVEYDGSQEPVELAPREQVYPLVRCVSVADEQDEIGRFVDEGRRLVFVLERPG